MAFGAAKHVVFAVIGVREVVDIAGAEAEELVETALRRTTPRRETDIPFAETSGRIAGLFQIVRKDAFAVWQTDADPVFRRAKLMRQTVPQGMASRENRPARRRATRRGHVKIGASHAFARQPVDTRCLDHLVAVTTQIAVTDIVQVEEQDVRLVGSRGFQRLTRGRYSCHEHQNSG